jgi:hypothetical protein
MKVGGPGRIQTRNHPIRSRTLYPVEPRGLGLCGGTRTPGFRIPSAALYRLSYTQSWHGRRRIELASSGLEADILPLNYARKMGALTRPIKSDAATVEWCKSSAFVHTSAGEKEMQ